jgi:hypothetical protein
VAAAPWTLARLAAVKVDWLDPGCGALTKAAIGAFIDRRQ